MGKVIIIDESKEPLLLSVLLRETVESTVPLEGPKNLAVVKYLDSKYKKASYNAYDTKKGEYGNKQIAVQVDRNMKVLASLTAESLLEKLDRAFQTYMPQPQESDAEEVKAQKIANRRNWLKNVMLAWYEGRINKKTGNIMPKR